MIELFPFEDAPKAHERMLSGDAHFRVVFDIATSGRRTRNPIARHRLRLWTTTQHQEWLENHAAAPLRRVTPPGYPQDIGKWRNNVIEHPAQVSVCLRRFCMGFEKWRDSPARDAQVAAVDSVQAATDTTVKMLSYRPDTVDADLGAARDRLTGSFRDSYTSLIHDVVIPGAKQKQISAVATVPAAASVSTSQNRAVVLVFVN